MIPENWTENKIKYIAKVNGRVGFKGYSKDDLVGPDEGAYTIGGKRAFPPFCQENISYLVISSFPKLVILTWSYLHYNQFTKFVKEDPFHEQIPAYR